MGDEPNYTPADGDYTPAHDYSHDVSQGGDTAAPSPQDSRNYMDYDPPIEHDPIGQAIIGLPAAFITGAGEVVIAGAEVADTAVEEGVSWVASEAISYFGEQAVEGGGRA